MSLWYEIPSDDIAPETIVFSRLTKIKIKNVLYIQKYNFKISNRYSLFFKLLRS